MGERTNFVELRIDSDDVLDLMIHLQLERVHLRIEVHSVQESHRQDLRISLSSISGSGSFGRSSTFSDDNICIRIIQSASCCEQIEGERTRDDICSRNHQHKYAMKY